MEMMATGPSRSISTESVSDIVRLPVISLPSFRGDAKASNPESRDSGSGPEPVIGPRYARTRWDHPGMTELDFQFTPRDPPIGFEIALAGGIHHACGQRWCWRVAVPAAGTALGVEIVAQGLLVETRLRLAGLVGVHVPKPGAVRRHHLVDQDDPPVRIAAELELGIGDDDSLVARKRLAERIDGARHALQRVGGLIADDLAHPRDGDVLVVPGLGLGRGTEDRRFEFGAFDQTGCKLLARQRSLLCVFLPC